MGGNFKFQVQDSFLEYFFFSNFGDLKNESHFLEKSHLENRLHEVWNKAVVPGKSKKKSISVGLCLFRTLG